MITNMSIPPAESSENLLSQSEERFRLLVSVVKDYAMFMLDPKGRIITWNAGAQHTKGYREDEILGKHFSVFYTPEDRARNRPLELLRIASELGRVEDEGWRVRKDGSQFWADVIITAVHNAKGQLIGYAKVTRDLTERKRTEDQLASKQIEINKLQKMESLGRLTGGIAHDFNNLIAGILGCAEMLEQTAIHDEARQDAAEIKKACGRASALVRQLMAFSRRQMAAPQMVQVNAVIENIIQLIRRSLPANIQLELALTPELPMIYADMGQLEQILINLVLNARDAMPEGGQLTLHTAASWVDEWSLIDGFPERPANAVLIAVSDTGTGMTQEVQEKMFEPFYTTKETGKGSGLGLSTVYGIVQQNKGGIAVFTSPGMGTTMKIFLPQPPQPVNPEDTPKQTSHPDKVPGGNELILVVEDEPLVLRNTVRALQAQGYTVLSAPDAEEALKLFRKTQNNLRLVISDVIMPGKTGKELAQIIRTENPNIEILFMSGYAPEVIATHGLLTNEVDFIEKPFSSVSLLQKVRAILRRRS
jgi:PAS domain S-box-containing protein